MGVTSVPEVDGRICFQRVSMQLAAVQVFPVHVHGADLAAVVGGVVVNAPVGVAAGAVDGQLQLSTVQLNAAPLHFHGLEDVEKLADTLLLLLKRKTKEREAKINFLI